MQGCGKDLCMLLEDCPEHSEREKEARFFDVQPQPTTEPVNCVQKAGQICERCLEKQGQFLALFLDRS